MSIQIQEDTQMQNYFNVSYILHIFRKTNAKINTNKGINNDNNNPNNTKKS